VRRFHRAGLAVGLGVLVFSGAAAEDDHELLFQRVKAHMLEHLASLPNYTCHQTIDRATRVGATWSYQDTVELEVAFSGRKEIFLRRGTNHFEEQSFEKAAQGGTLSSRVLGADIDAVFSGNAADVKYAGPSKKDGHKTLRFDLRVPIERSHYHITRTGADAIAGYEGSVWVDADTLDLVRVDLKTKQIPAYVGVILVLESLHYKKVKIGNSAVDLPDHSELSVTEDNGHYSVNTMKLRGCHEYAADSVVTYDLPSKGRDH
jgi:hypothetical protein